MPRTLPTMLVFLVFSLIALALLLVLTAMVIGYVLPALSALVVRVPFRQGISSVCYWISNLKALHQSQDDDDENSDDLDDSTAVLISMLDEASIVLDQSDQVIQANPAAYRVGIVQDDQIVNKRVLDQVHQVRVQGGRREFNLTTQTPQQFVEIPKTQGSDFNQQQEMDGISRPNWLKATVGRINERFVVVLLEDVSEVVRFSQVRDAFIINVSEQLLRPTEALKGLADSLESGNLNPEQIKQDARQVRTSCRHLSHMISDLLLLIKAQEPVTPRHENEISVKQQLDAVAASLAPMSKRLKVGIVVDADDSLVINAEADQIRAAVGKLVENALIYSHRGSHVTVSAVRTAAGDRALIRVVDRGTGIARDEQEHVFERFFRGRQQSQRSEDGVGLGLAIVKHVALTHHGSVGLWSSPGQGSTFSLLLPLSR